MAVVIFRNYHNKIIRIPLVCIVGLGININQLSTTIKCAWQLLGMKEYIPWTRSVLNPLRDNTLQSLESTPE